MKLCDEKGTVFKPNETECRSVAYPRHMAAAGLHKTSHRAMAEQFRRKCKNIKAFSFSLFPSLILQSDRFERRSYKNTVFCRTRRLFHHRGQALVVFTVSIRSALATIATVYRCI